MAAATLDLALVALIERRLRQDATEQESFLGTDGDGRAPLGSFGARIQLAYLTGLISKTDAEVLRSIKAIRNIFAHRLKATFATPAVVKEVKRMHAAWLRAVRTPREHAQRISRDIGKDEVESQGILMIVFANYQMFFFRLLPTVTPVHDDDSTRQAG